MSDHLQSPGGRASTDSVAQPGSAADRPIEQAPLARSPREQDGVDPAPAAPVALDRPASAGTPLFLPPLPLRAGALPCGEVIDLYMARYKGRDTTRVQRLTWWQSQVGRVPLQDLSDDHVHAALEGLAQQHSRFFAGKDADGKPILKAKRKPNSGATINRYSASLAAVVTWAIKSRVAPKGFVHPSRSIARRAEGDGKTRFLSAPELRRLLDACKASTWPRLYALVLLAVTTGARKSELLGLRWGDIDFERAVAHCGRTKNGDPKVLPLVPAIAAELERFKAGPGALVFESSRRKEQAFAFELKFTEALMAAKVKAFRFHDLRHSCASMLASSGASLLEIADVLGHRQLAMTRR